MTMTEVKSIEETLIKISLKTLYFIGGSLVIATFVAVMLYRDIMKGQDDILAEVKKNATERMYEVKDIRRDSEIQRKDIQDIDDRVARLETKE
jgi:hypothetical protein